ncbi:hypothetical protein QCA50_020729 [Cerrena zonata]|uniref:Uncharacterized protein n=1 Tax=Cerrena zonata TaxID=2478898 RepID=A0AAW0F9X3_9APHY
MATPHNRSLLHYRPTIAAAPSPIAAPAPAPAGGAAPAITNVLHITIAQVNEISLSKSIKDLIGGKSTL